MRSNREVSRDARAQTTVSDKGGRAGRGRAGRGRSDGAARDRTERASLYDEVTARIVAELEGGRIPWVQPWSRDIACGSGSSGAGTGAIPLGLPVNGLTQRAYSGVNVLILWLTAMERGFASHGWMTFRQAALAGGSVRKGEKGTCVVYADRFTPEAEKARARDTGENARQVAFLKRFTVFNLAQIEGLDDDLCPAPVALPEREVVPVAERLIAASGIDFRIGGADAFYSPGHDFVQVPPQQAFHDQVNFYRTAMHECCHATGHASRLNRNLQNSFGSKDYAREELVALSGQSAPPATLE